MLLSHFDCSPEVLRAAIGRFRDKKVLIFGDVMLDKFVWGSVTRISPEAPVPVVEIRRQTSCLGGAANVAANISGLGGAALPLAVVGNDAEGDELRTLCRQLGIHTGGILMDGGRATSVKTRIIAHHQQVCRTDREDRTPIAPALQRAMSDWYRKNLQQADAVIVSDYAKGLVSAPLLRKILPAAQAAGKIVCVDPKLRNLAAYRPATVITPNLLEAERAAGISIQDDKTLILAGKKILKQTGIEHLLVTCGEQGMALFDGNAHPRVTQIPTLAREVFDVTGAGDTVISTLALGLASGLSILEAAILSNIAAGIVVGKLGTATVSPEELLRGIRQSG